jgi:predicted MPP superfamily phosphohydrolase
VRKYFLTAALCLLSLANCSQLKGQASADTLKFAFFSDIHFGKTDYNGEALYPADWIKKALNGISRRQADLILVGGDLIESSGNTGQFDMFDQAMITAIPWYPMPGNHDIGTTPASVTMTSINKWLAHNYGRGPAKREYYGFTYKNLAAFYVLNTQAYIADDPLAKARSMNQLAEMDSFFTANKDFPIKIVTAHVPVFEARQNEDSLYFNIGPSYRSKVLDLMNRHNVKYYVAGHQHVNGQAMDKGILVYFNTALSFQLGSGNTRGYYVYTVTKDTVLRSFYPLSSENQYELKVDPGSHGTINLSPSKAFYDSAEVVQVTAVPNNGWKFLRWYGSLSGSSNPDTIIMNYDKSITAIYGETNPTCDIITGKSGLGQVILDPPGGVYNENTVVKISAQPQEGWELQEWTGEKNGSFIEDTLIMDRDCEVKALFKKKDEAPVSLKAIEDSYVRGGLMYSSKNMGKETVLKVLEGTSDSYRCRSYIKFNIKGLKADPLSVTLKMKAGSLPDGNRARAFVYFLSGGSWKEYDIQWRNVPSVTESLMDSCMTINKTGNYYSWNLTEKVKQAVASGDTVISLLIKDKSAFNRTVDFFSRESSDMPELIVVENNTSGVVNGGNTVPAQYKLEQNYPNPFNPATEITYSTPGAGHVSLKVYDIMGREISVLEDSFKPSGTYRFTWNAKDKAGRALPSGIYILTMKAPDYLSSIKMNLLK